MRYVFLLAISAALLGLLAREAAAQQCQGGARGSPMTAATGQTTAGTSAFSGSISSQANPYASAMGSIPSAQAFWMQQYAASVAKEARRQERHQRIMQQLIAQRQKRMAVEAAKDAARSSPGYGLARQ